MDTNSCDTLHELNKKINALTHGCQRMVISKTLGKHSVIDRVKLYPDIGTKNTAQLIVLLNRREHLIAAEEYEAITLIEYGARLTSSEDNTHRNNDRPRCSIQ